MKACAAKKIPLLLIGLAVSACNPLESLRSLFGLASNSPREPLSSPAPEKKVEVSESFARGRRELLSEMIRVVFDSAQVEDEELFSELSSSLLQGASLEGVYRGIVVAQKYRALESKSAAATPAQLRFFAFELARIQEGMKQPTRFNTPESRGVPNIEFPEGDAAPDAESPSSASLGVPERTLPLKEREDRFLRDFIGTSPFTLKRILGDEVLKKIDEIKGAPEDLAQWYAATVVRLGERRIDFGLSLRNSQDFDLHAGYAKKVELDRVVWELLTRYHRCVNALAKN